MPRPMTKYRSGIQTVTVNRWLSCVACGAESFRSRTFTGPLATQDAEAWQPDPHCAKHLRENARRAVGL